MKILHVIVGLDVGGAELMLSRLIESHLGGTRYQHTIVSLTSLGDVGLRLKNQGVQIHVLGMKSFAGTPIIIWKLVRMMRRIRPDIVQTWMYHSDLLGGLAARLAGFDGVIWGVRTTQVASGGSRATAFVRSLCARLSRLLPHTIVCAAEASRRAHIAVGYDASRMAVVPNGFNTARLIAAPEQRLAFRHQCGWNIDTVVVGYLGRFHKVKNPENFVRAAGLLAQRYGNVRFLMVGRHLDANNVELAEWIRSTGCADRFALLGERNDVPVCLAAMDVFCLASRTEGFPNVVGEAMAMGLPCVVTDVGDAAMLVADTGVVVPKEDSVALSKGLEQLVAMTSEERARLGQQAKARIYAEFTMDRARERFEAIYQQVSKKGRV